MKKKIALLVVLSMLLGGVVSYASLYGTFEGNPVVRVQSNGQTVAVEDVPAINLNGRTMVPIYMLRNLGANVEWDGSTESVNVSLSDKNSLTLNESVELYRDIQALRFFITLYDQNTHLNSLIKVVQSSYNDYEIQQALDLVNNMDISTINLLLSGSKRNEYKENAQFETVVKALSQGKDYLLQLDAQSASNQWLVAQSTLNSIYFSLDQRMNQHAANLIPVVMDENYKLKTN